MSKAQEPPCSVTPQSLLTKDLVRRALTADKGPDAEILSWEVKDFTNKGDNYACVVTSVDVRYRHGDQEKEVTYVAKCNPCRNIELFNEFSAMLFEKEANFYDKLVPLINAELKSAGQELLRMATFYVSHQKKNEEVIMLRDLRPDGFKMFDRKKGMDVDHATLVLRELARLHAASVLAQAKMNEPMEVTYSFLQKDFISMTGSSDIDDKCSEMFQDLFYNNLKTGATMAEKTGGYEMVVNWLRRHARQGGDLLRESLVKSPPFDVLCHGDCWNNNILFKYDESGKPVDVRLLDLQVCRKASPATDINYFMYTSFNGPVRRNNLQAFLKTYYDSFTQVLSAVGKEMPFTLEELKKEYHSKNGFGLLMCLMVVPLVVAEAADVPDFHEMSQDMEVAMKEFQQQMLDQLDRNPLLRPRLLATFEDMMEYGVIS